MKSSIACKLQRNYTHYNERIYFEILQETVKRILDNLPMYIFHAIKRVRYKPQFYPTFDFDKLYPLISVKRYGLEQINPQLLVTQNDVSILFFTMG